jgi:hypothetical protein
MAYLISPLGRPDDYTLFLSSTPPEKVLWVLTEAGIAPMVEEMLFRGCFYRLLRDEYGTVGVTLLLNVAFAALHSPGIGQMTTAFMRGLIFTYAYQKTGTV